MTSFPLKIVTPDGLAYDGPAEEVIVRAISGDMGILAGHVNCIAPLGMGKATVVAGGKRRHAACIGGILSVMNGKVTLLPTTFEWVENIDPHRAERAYEKAQSVLQDKSATAADIRLAQAKLRRALVRKSVAGKM